MKRLFLLLFISPAVLILSAQDTLKIQTFTWDDTHRADTFDFPDNSGQTYRKILMKYNMRCHDGIIGNGSNGCYEWDYSCNTFITDPTRLDSTRSLAPEYTITNFSGTSFPYSFSPTFLYTAYPLHETTLQPNTSPVDVDFALQGLSTSLAPGAKTYRYQVILQGADLVSSGLQAGLVYGIRLKVSEAAGTVGFVKIRMKNTDQVATGPLPDEIDIQEVYHNSTDFSTTGDIELPFYQPFDWYGENMLIDFSITTGNADDVPVFDFVESANDESALHSMPGAQENNLYFGGVSSLDLQPTTFENIQNEITVSFWSFGNPANLPANTQVFDATDANGQRQANVHLPWSNGEVYWDCGNNGSGYDRINKAAATADYEGKWNHWAFTKNAITGEMKIFLNGQLWHSGTGKTKPINIDAFRFGQSLVNTNPYFGSLDEIQIWDKALDVNTIRDWMFKQVDATHPEYTRLVGYYKLNEGTGNTATDASGEIADASLTLPEWGLIRGDRLFHNFSNTSLSPKLTFLQGDYSIIDMPVTVLDSVQSPIHQVVHFGISGSALIRLDTQYLYPAGILPVYNESGMQVDSIYVPEDGTIDIETLVYYTTREARYELLSLVTPYGIGLDLSPQGKTFTFDVTDFAPILQGKRRLSIEFGGENQEELDIEFWFITGTPERDVLDIQPIWPQGRGYFSEIQSDVRFEPRQVPLRADASFYKIRSAITGHEQNGEFVPRQHYININGGAQEFTYDVWKSCSRNPIYPQGGTWIFDRAGWCPGMATDVHSFSLDGLAQPGQTIEIDYGLNGAHMASANYLVNNQLVSYGAFNFSLDASIEAIVRPSKGSVEFERVNPACNTATVRIKNGGAESIQSITFSYSTTSSNTQFYTWTGNLSRQAELDIVLPEPPPGFWQAGSLFLVTIDEVNGVADGNSENDYMSSRYDQTRVFNYVDPVQLRVSTNATGSDYSYTIKDGTGAIVMQRNNMASNTVYTDDLTFPAGCYTLDFKDAGEDGLSFWFFPENGNGSLRFQRRFPSGSIATLYSFEPDFGAGVQFDFVFGDIFSATQETDQSFQLFSTYPNPASDEVNIELIGFEGRDFKFRLVDMTGKTMLEKYFKSEWSKETTQIDISRLPPGMYVLHGTDGKRNWMREVVKLN